MLWHEHPLEFCSPSWDPFPMMAFPPIAHSYTKLKTSVHTYRNQQYILMQLNKTALCVCHSLTLPGVKELIFHRYLSLWNRATRLSCASWTFAASAAGGSSWFTVRDSRIWSTKLQLLPQQNSKCQGAKNMTNGSKITWHLWFAVQSSNSNQGWALLSSFMV